MKNNPALIAMLRNKTGCNLSSPSEAEFLRNDIEAVTGERLGINTVKRIVGILDYEGQHRDYVLDIIARYLNYSSWSLLERDLNNKISEFGTSSSILDLNLLPQNQKIEIKWDPDRKIILEKSNSSHFTVIESNNSKLIEGDILKVTQIAAGFPFYVSDVLRKGESIGKYTAALEDGLKSIKLL